MCFTKIYGVWRTMIQRCHNANTDCWYRYGGRGIKVCVRWREDFRNFLSDMGSGYKEGLSLDRIDGTGDYCVENCRWATTAVQQANRHILPCFNKKWEKRLRKNLTAGFGKRNKIVVDKRPEL